MLARRPGRVKTAVMDADPAATTVAGASGAEERERAVADQALAVAAAWSPPDAPPSWWLTAAILTAIARDDVLRAVAAGIPADRVPALLLSAALVRLAGQRPDDPVARYLPRPGGEQPPDDGGFPAAVAAFARAERDELARLCAGHRYQMNEVARCLDVVPVLGRIAARDGRPLALVDLGTGAGLALHLDRYAYRYRLADGTSLTCGDPGATVRLECAVRGVAPVVPDRVPPILGRVGIDVEPHDLADPQTYGWLAACVPPEATAVTRFAAAAAITRSEGARAVRGDVLDVLLDAVAGMPEEATVCLLDTYVHVFLPPDRLARFDALLDHLSRRRQIEWISVDPLVPLGPDATTTVQGLDVPAGWLEDNRAGGVFGVVGHVSVRDGVRTGQVLGRSHPSAAWLEWLDRPAERTRPGGRIRGT
ncbi:protein of unknown function UCP012608 [Pseudonocardia dioxanivorans CB1190]|uniref:DUF2332 domain-containing protein n=2 Tax=Pseudonocardia dioxanivorans TaxID=240495 RepID=F4CY13_PSEUX|nr:protein of unknown function UCP012608 [Pseudonocardia dioxanivorans CB1190]